MYLSSFLQEQLIILDKDFQDWSDMMSQIIPLMTQDLHLELSNTDIENMFKTREAEQTTIFPAGIGIPHIRLEHLGDPVIAIIVPKTPLNINNLDVRMFFVIISDKAASKLYLNLVKAFMGIAKNKELFEDLCKQQTAESFISLIRNQGILVLDEVNVGDVMTIHFKTVKTDTPLSLLSDMFYKQQYQYFPVQDKEGKVVGEVTLLDYLKVGVPKYALLLDHVKFPRTIEPLADIFKHENTLTVSEIMSPISIFLDVNSSIAEAVYLMVKHQRRLLPVFQDGKFAGILFASDIFKKLIRG
ncbi:MAG TPA: PTS sugar transporter subunit IIA [Candidatus Cloacimonadota bacterium]|nr:PTS sugar transporter subunit IIA [Candidatus Cloacimonadota bacterium]HPT70935.1 PTS sugar transporter subunit IIA [Candidatus Cloacimonadota bacterium]